MVSVNVDLKKVVNRVKNVQSQLQTFLKDQTWLEEARKYAERQSREVKKLFASDVVKVKTFLGRERKELERFQKQLPQEVAKIRKFVTQQKKEFERLLINVRKGSVGTKKTVRSATKRRTPKKTTSATSETTP